MYDRFNKLRAATAAVALVTFAGAVPAYAADAIEEPPEPEAAPPVEAVQTVTPWAGPYAGIALGYGFEGSTETDIPPGNDINTDGFVGSGFAGWNFQNGGFVYGLEGDVGYNGMEGDNAGVDSESGIDGSLRARLGLAATDNLLVYGTAGGAAERLEITDPAGSDTGTMLGWTAGAGIDAKLTEQVFGRLEYRYTDYGSETFDTGSGDQSVSSSNNKVLLGVGMQF